MEEAKIRSSSRSYGSTQSKNVTVQVVYVRHKVLPDESIMSLSIKHDAPVGFLLKLYCSLTFLLQAHNIRKANRLMPSDAIYPGMEIYIPTKLNPTMLTVDCMMFFLSIISFLQFCFRP